MEKPLIQSIIEDAGHVCLFLPWFHCELNVIEMLWGYAKFCVCGIHSLHTAWSFISSFAFQDIVILQMGSLTLPKLLSHSVLIHAISSRFASFSRKCGDILMRTGMCYLHTCVYAYVLS